MNPKYLTAPKFSSHSPTMLGIGLRNWHQLSKKFKAISIRSTSITGCLPTVVMTTSSVLLRIARSKTKVHNRGERMIPCGQTFPTLTRSSLPLNWARTIAFVGSFLVNPGLCFSTPNFPALSYLSIIIFWFQ